MSTQLTRRDPWRWPSIFLWLLFFLLGIWPEMSFTLLRMAGYVFSQNAVVNSYNAITWALAGYITYFTYHRCLEADLPAIEALGKGIQLGFLAMFAFWDIPFGHISDVLNPTLLAMMLGATLMKLVLWLYLYSLVVRYCWRRNPEIIAQSLHYFGLNPPAPARRERSADRSSETPEGKPLPHGTPMEEQAD